MYKRQVPERLWPARQQRAFGVAEPAGAGCGGAGSSVGLVLLGIGGGLGADLSAAELGLSLIHI